MLGFFEPTEADPKPCKSTSPTEKSDSGIDLTGRASRTSEAGTQHDPSDAGHQGEPVADGPAAMSQSWR